MARSTTRQKQQETWRIATATDVGRVRPHNEDSFAVLDTAQLRAIYDFALIVADGMGGRNAGEVASRAAVEAVSQAILNNVSITDTHALLRFAVEAAHLAVQQRADESPLYEGMGTTLVVALVKDDQLWVAHVGDSRAYLLRGERLIALTEDHTFVAEQVRAGGMSLEQARHSRFRHMLTRAVGTNAEYTPDISTVELERGDAILLCTDGLTNMLSEEEIAHLVRRHRHRPEQACRSLIDAANASGGQDNITVLLAVDSRDTVAGTSNGEELQTVSELPTVREPLYRAMQLARQIPLGYAVAAGVLVVVLFALWGILAARKPQPAPLPPPPPVLDLARVRYSEPQVLLNKPLRGAPLVIDPQGRIYTMSEQGRVLCISPEGKILMTAKEPFSGAVSPDIKPDMVYFAVDVQGNLYVCDRANRRILKYRPDGQLVGTIGERKLTRPAAIAVGADGSVYVIDAGKLTVIRAIPSEVNDAPQPNR
ncbi:MAG: Stp1/IreP family PP2C-type Ser/Thr phosphatase [Chthonomonadetes bacterium]|nr:Stp1/IreP family PP2C-type Ser/Thr phosphatase [Chthonomonadetes bacterium]